MSHGAAGQDSDVGVGLESGAVYERDGADRQNGVRLESDDVRAAVVDGCLVLYDDLGKEKEGRNGGRKGGREEGRWGDEG